MATVVESESLLKDAALIVDVCMSVEKDDVVTIICDDDHASQAAAIAELVVDRGAWPVVMNNETQVRRGRADVRFPMAPPRNLHQAMVGSDEGIIITNLEGGGHGPRGPDGGRHPQGDTAGKGRYCSAGRKEARARHHPARHRFHRVH